MQSRPSALGITRPPILLAPVFVLPAAFGGSFSRLEGMTPWQLGLSNVSGVAAQISEAPSLCRRFLCGAHPLQLPPPPQAQILSPRCSGTTGPSVDAPACPAAWTLSLGCKPRQLPNSPCSLAHRVPSCAACCPVSPGTHLVPCVSCSQELSHSPESPGWKQPLSLCIKFI